MFPWEKHTEVIENYPYTSYRDCHKKIRTCRREKQYLNDNPNVKCRKGIS